MRVELVVGLEHDCSKSTMSTQVFPPNFGATYGRFLGPPEFFLPWVREGVQGGNGIKKNRLEIEDKVSSYSYSRLTLITIFEQQSHARRGSHMPF